MALDKNDGTFLPSIEGVVGGKTSQVDGMNGIMNNLIGNDNYLKDKKLDRGNYVGSGELLRKDDNGIWGGEYGGGLIEDPSVTKVVGKRYIGADGKAYICLKPSNINNSTNYTPCNVVDNLDKLQNLIENLGIKKIEIGNFSIGTPSSAGATKTISFRNSFTKAPALFISQTNYGSPTNEWVAVQTSKVTTTNFVARHAGGTSNFSPNFNYIAIETII